MDERRSAGRAPGPSDAAAAMIMSNSVQQWDRSYDLKIRKREAQAGANEMLVWKQHMLEQSRGKGGQGAVESEVGEASDGEEAGPSSLGDWEEHSWQGDSTSEEEEEGDSEEEDVVLEL